MSIKGLLKISKQICSVHFTTNACL